MDAWASSLPARQSVALTAGSNAAADQPAIGLGVAQKENRLAGETGFPNRCVKLAKDARVAQEIASLTPVGHFQRTHNRPPKQNGPSQELQSFRSQLLSDAKL
eukprot:9030634-Pyramimonas_sp.AAC.1